VWSRVFALAFTAEFKSWSNIKKKMNPGSAAEPVCEHHKPPGALAQLSPICSSAPESQDRNNQGGKTSRAITYPLLPNTIHTNFQKLPVFFSKP